MTGPEQTRPPARGRPQNETAARSGGVGFWEWNVGTGELVTDVPAMLGYDPDRLTFHVDDLVKVIHPDDVIPAMTEATRHLKGLTGLYELEIRVRHQNGALHWFLVRGTREVDSAGRTTRIAGTATDITTRKRSEEELTRRCRRLTQTVADQTARLAEADRRRQQATDLRRAAETERKRSEAALIAVLDALGETALVLDDQGVVLTAGREAAAGLGTTADDLVGQAIFGALESGAAARLRAKIEQVRATGRPVRFRDERPGLIQDTTIRPVLDPQGEVDRLVVIARDVTERVRTEATLRENEEKYRELVDQGPVGVFEIDLASRRFTRVNDLVCERTGFTREELLSLEVQDLFTAASQDLFLERLAQMQRAGEGLTDTEEYEVRTQDGQTIWVSTSSRVVHRDGRPALVTGIAQDITAQKLAERAFQRRVELQRAFSVLSSEFTSSPPDRIDDVVADTLATVGRAGGADRCVLYERTEVGPIMDNTQEWCAPGVEPRIDARQGLSFETCHWFMEQLTRFQYVSIERLAGLPQAGSAERKFLRNLGVLSLLAVPLHLDGNLIGWLGLESSVQERTWSKDDIGLLTMVGDLLMLALGRKQAAEALAGKRFEVEALARELDKADSTVTTLLKRLDQQEASLQRDVVENISTLVGPYVERLAGTHLDSDQRQYLAQIKTNLDKVVSPFARALKSEWARLTPMEIQVAQLVRDGHQSLQIADMLNISPSAVAFHRRNIRRKLGLRSRKQSLMAHLLSLSRDAVPTGGGPAQA